MPQKSKVLIAASSKSRAKVLARAISFVNREVDAVVGASVPKSFSDYRLLICEVGARLKSPEHLLRGLRKDAHVVLILPVLDVRWIAYYMQDRRINHILMWSVDCSDLAPVVHKLETGQIFGLERYLPAHAEVSYRRLDSFATRCGLLDEIEQQLRAKRVRGSLRRAAVQVTEELVMNAMYQAPLNERGERIFESISPKSRIRRRTPRPVSVRFAVVDKSFYVSVRDRFGSFQRDDLARYLLRCATEEVQIEDKQLGAGLGLYLVTSRANHFVVNILPGAVSEFICVIRPVRPRESSSQCLSVTTQLPPNSR
jgi:hypothetical protein